MIVPNFKARASSPSVWSPGQRQQEVTPVEIRRSFSNKNGKNEAIPVVWTPASSPTVERKEFRPVSFESPVLSRKNKPPETLSPQSSPISKPQLPWESPSSTISEASSSISKASKTLFDRSLPASRSSPAINNGFSAFCRLPKVQPPTITLLQKAREGCFPKGPNYIEKENSTPRNYGPSSLVDLRYETKNEYFSEPESGKPNKMANSRPRQYSGIGPTTKEGMPLILRSEVRDQNHHKWYKKMYDTIHKEKPYKDEYVTVRYKQKRAQYPNASGYLSEPEPGAYDSDHQNDYKYQTIDRRRTPMRERENWYNHCTATMPRNVPTVKSSSSSDILGARKLATPHLGKIENYTPGHSSISDKEEKEQFEHQKQPPAPPAKSFINQALRESGYESDSTLVFKRKENEASSLSPTEQKQAYKVIQQGGDVPLHGLRKVVPDKPKDFNPPIPPPKGHHGIMRSDDTRLKVKDGTIVVFFVPTDI